MNIRKKSINLWDGGIQTSPRDNNQNTSYGSQVVKHFDIYTDPKRLIPMPSWDSFTQTNEKAYNIRAMGGFSDTVLGIGKALSNWYSSSWDYRVKLTLNASLFTGAGLPLRLDLSDMPAGFWSNIQSDGADIRAVSKDNVIIPFELENFDFTNQTGEIWIDSISLTSATADYLYIYYGNSTVNAIGEGVVNAPESTWDSLNLKFAFTFPEDVQNNVNNEQEFTTSPFYSAGLFGTAINTEPTGLTTLTTDEVALTSNDITVSFMLKLRAAPGSQTTILKEINNNWFIDVRTDRKLEWTVVGDGGSATLISTDALTVDQWYVIDCLYDGSYSIYVDNSLTFASDNNGNFTDNATNNGVVIQTTQGGVNFCHIAQVWGINGELSAARIATKYNNFTNASFWTISAQETFASLSAQYSGTQVYTKNISSGDWEEYIEGGQTVRSDKYPVNGFIEQEGDIYFVLSEGEDSGRQWLARTDNQVVIDDEHLQLAIMSANSKVRPTSVSPVDGSVYFTQGNSDLAEVGEPGSDDVYSADSTIISTTPWRSYLAMGYTRRTRAILELWDLVGSNAVEKIDVGTGNLRIAGNASDILFAVTDNYIDDDILSSNTPAMEVKVYVGNGRMESVVRLSIPATYTGWVDDWERAVSFFKVRRNDTTLFYAKIPTNDTATTFDQGFWAVGKNSQGQLALTLLIDTSEFDAPENVYGFAQQVFFIEKDGGIQRLATDGTYDKTSLYTTLKMNEGNSEIQKKLHGVEIVTEPLEAGQTISLYYRIDGSSTRVKIGDFTGTDEFAFEKVDNDDATALPEYQEIEFDIESTGGKSSILEFNYRYEYLGEIV